MDAIIFHAAGDESLAGELRDKVAPLRCVVACCAPDADLMAGEHLLCFGLWTDVASALGLERFFLQVEEATRGRYARVITGTAALPDEFAPVPTLSLNSAPQDFAALAKALRAVTAARSDVASSLHRVAPETSGWMTGVGAGVAIYATMFAAAGAWRGEAVSQVIEANEGPQFLAQAARTVAFSSEATERRYSLSARFTSSPNAASTASALAPAAASPFGNERLPPAAEVLISVRASEY